MRKNAKLIPSTIMTIALAMALVPGIALAEDAVATQAASSSPVASALSSAAVSAPKADQATVSAAAAKAELSSKTAAATTAKAEQATVATAASTAGSASATSVVSQFSTAVAGEAEAASSAAAAKADSAEIRTQKASAYESAKVDKKLSYDPEAIAAIGSQEKSGHSICCPSYACAYADAVLDGTVRDHEYYTCSNCTWPDWGGGGSSFRNVGSDEQLLREAYDQIAAGKPTVIHVTWSGGEHWIALIGYQNATDPDHLTLDNFIALDPWDGAEIVASSKYSLYGDGCEHISDR